MSNNNKTYLVTGGSGFIGLRLCNAIQLSGINLHLILRKKNEFIKCKQFISNFDCGVIDNQAFLGVDTVFHLVGYAHDLSSNQEINKYQEINVNFAMKVANMAIANKVKNFVFVSSVKAGGSVISDRCVNENDQSEPKGAYGRTKREAELELLKIGQESGMHVSIIRPSLVYGPGVKGNLLLMLSAVKKGWLPPLPETGNKKSMIHVDDLVKAILLVSKYDCTNGEIYIATDGRLYSSREIYETMCNLVGKSIPKWSVPKFLFDMVALISPRIKYKVDKLLGDECYSSEKLEGLGFRPQRALEEMNETSF